MHELEFQEFRKDFIEDVRSMSNATGDGYTATFAAEAADQLIESEVLMDYLPSFYTDVWKRKKLRVDGYTYNEFDHTMNLILAHCDASKDRWTLTKTMATHDFGELQTFLAASLQSDLYQEIEASTPCADLVDLLRAERENIRKYRFFVLTDGNVSTTIKSLDQESYEGIPIEKNIWDLHRIFRVATSAQGHEPIEIDFTAYVPNGLSCIEASSAATTEFRSYLGVIPGTVLADIYDEYQSRLLEGNVRSFLSTKVAVNKKIRSTILTAPEKFFAFNNGISATATDVQFTQTPQGRFISRVRDFQIINGGQTTASISNARYRDHADISHIYVQMKLTKIDAADAEASDNLIRDISRSSNSQNKVTDADFFASHPFHRRMEQLSKKTYAPAANGAQYETLWFYERARGSYDQAQMRLTKAQKKKFQLQHPKDQRIRKTDLAKVVNAWWGHPDIVSKGAQTNFNAFAQTIDDMWQKNEAQFNARWFQKMVALILMFRRLEKAIPKQPWYQNGYRANIICYTLALFHQSVKKKCKGHELDLVKIWSEQDLSASLLSALLATAEMVAAALTDASRPVQNVTQWCKRSACWTRVQKIDLPFSLDMAENLISGGEEAGERKFARKTQHMDEGIEAQKAVLAYPKPMWKKLHIYLIGRHLLTNATDSRALAMAEKIPIKLPNSFQCHRLLELLREAEEDGFQKELSET